MRYLKDILLFRTSAAVTFHPGPQCLLWRRNRLESEQRLRGRVRRHEGAECASTDRGRQPGLRCREEAAPCLPIPPLLPYEELKLEIPEMLKEFGSYNYHKEKTVPAFRT